MIIFLKIYARAHYFVSCSPCLRFFSCGRAACMFVGLLGLCVKINYQMCAAWCCRCCVVQCVLPSVLTFLLYKRCVGRLGLCGWAVWRVCCAFLFLLLCFAGGEIMAFGVLQGVFFMEKVIFF